MKFLHVNDRPFLVSTPVVAALTIALILPFWAGHGRLRWHPHASAGPRPPSTVHFTFRGPSSTFGGPKDTHMSRSDDLALFPTQADAQEPEVQGYFLWPPPPGITGTLRQLDPRKFYIACRWDYDKSSKNPLRRSFVTFTNPKNGRSTLAKPVDCGPAASTGRSADLSPGLADHLGLKGNDPVIVTFTPSP